VSRTSATDPSETTVLLRNDRPIRAVRELTRYRKRQIEDRAQEVNRLYRVLEDAGLKLASVMTDVMGRSGRAMLEALITGQADPATMAALAKRRMRSKIPALEQALTGTVRDHHRRLLAMQLRHIDFLDEQIAALNSAIAQCVNLASGNLEGARSGGRSLREGAAVRNALLAAAMGKYGVPGC